MTHQPLAIGLDLGTSCGYAVLEGAKHVASGQWKLMPRNAHPGERWLNFRVRLGELFQEYNPDYVAFELVRRHQGTRAAHVYGGLLAEIEVRDAMMTDVEFVGIGVGTWKKSSIGIGNATKTQYIQAMSKRYDLPLGKKDEDEAAALGIVTALRKLKDL